jgi:hypothetical protein
MIVFVEESDVLFGWLYNATWLGDFLILAVVPLPNQNHYPVAEDPKL